MSIYLGVGLALCSTACSATGYTLQKIAHNRVDADARKAQAIAQQSPATSISTKRSESDGNEPQAATAGPDTQAISDAKPTSPPADARDVLDGPPPAIADLGSASDSRQSLKHADPQEKPQKPKSFWKYWQFPAGLAFLIVGTIFAAFVFGLAPQSTLAPLGSVTMILNTIFSWRFLGESFTRVDGVSLALMAVGTTVAVLFGKSNDPKYTYVLCSRCVVGYVRVWWRAIRGACVPFKSAASPLPIRVVTPCAASVHVPGLTRSWTCSWIDLKHGVCALLPACASSRA